ncbi:glycosyl transferase [Thauera sp. 28]|uniref:glycosyltransferase family 25 protein n=1 Tax=Thauera sp. 28 TaxID=303682 RepID=UPI0002D02EE5|nr:glycosyltransferase family 25 protein [Thauera sp. 28]ENO91852.1 glycosyl transferase [Thauera sp. 28]
MNSREFDVFVVNMARSRDRLERMSALLEDTGLSFERFEAVDGSVEDVSKCYDSAKQLSSGYRDLSRAELGCYLSHVRLWEKAAERSSGFVVVLEDDIDIEGGIAQLLEGVAGLQCSWDLIRLAGLGEVPYVRLGHLDQNHELVALMRGSTGTQGYCISPDGARKLLAKALPITMPVDVYIDYDWISGIQTLAIMPYPVQENREISSTISGQRVASSSSHQQAGISMGMKYKMMRWLRKRRIAILKTARYPILFIWALVLRGRVGLKF